MDLERQQPKFGIGAVARITGIPPDTLRIWERRYCVVEPDRGNAHRRLYDRADITRLTLIKQLVDQGNAISTVAGLSEDELKEKLQVHEHAAKAAAGAPVSAPELISPAEGLEVLVYGDALPLLWDKQPREAYGLRLSGTHTSLVDLERQAARQAPDALVLEFPSVQKDTVAEVRSLLRRTGVKHCVVVYGFGAKDALRRLDTPPVRTLRAPADLADVARVLFETLPGMAADAAHPLIARHPGKLPPRKFDNRELARVASASTTVECECPHHMVDLIYKLHAFEVYSSECESRDNKDAALHAYLYKTTAQARAVMETALERLIEVEGIDITADPGDR